ncbi:proto-oncogene vav-like, partial [Sinocyclocheilus anshuiensis]|uniref:proto-oncogene vav-like n=1 Tax=Sinocyclocheilus anshuiensis TaxID=1608454 RepID=UPI0007B95CE0
IKNIRTFLCACQEKFGMRKNELFEAFELFDVRDFAKVIDTLSILSQTPLALQRGFRPFPDEACVGDDDIYTGLSDQIDDTVEEDDDLYDCVEEDENEGDDIYEDLMRTEEPETQQKVEVDKRSCCLQEIRQTEEKYTNTLESILQHFLKPLQPFLQPVDIENIFINVQDLAKTHRSLLHELQESILHLRAENLHQIFIDYKERLLLYGRYCSQVEAATKHLDKITSTHEDVKMKLEECSMRANSGRFSLRDLLMVPMQRVLKYHLLLQELVKHTVDQQEKENLRTALDAMRVSVCVCVCVCVCERVCVGRNLTIGEVGWFPCSKVQPFAKTLLTSRSDGTFLVRQKDAGEFAISLKFNMDTRHIKVTYSEGLYRINEKKAFKGLFELVQYYQENSLRECFKDVDSRLQTPYKQPEQSAAPQHSSTRHAGVSERYHGTAKVRYDFSARDRTELSLREGDTVKILSKKAHNGWWKGEVYGRVGLFPANYVEEEHSDYC